MNEFSNILLSQFGGDLSLCWIIAMLHFLWQGCLLSLPFCVAVTFVSVVVPAELRVASRDTPLRVMDDAVTASELHVAESHVAESFRDSDQRLGGDAAT